MTQATTHMTTRAVTDDVVFHVADAHRFRIDQTFIEQYVGREPAWGPVGKVAYARTYARELRGPELVEHLMRDRGLAARDARARARALRVVREEFWQTARRVVEFTWTIFKGAALKAHHPWDEAEAQEKAQEMFRRLWAFKWLPPGRGMQFAGTPVVEKKGGAALNNPLHEDTRVLTQEHGWVRLGDIEGQRVRVLSSTHDYGAHAEKTSGGMSAQAVWAEAQISHVEQHPCFRITVEDRHGNQTAIVSSQNHRWFRRRAKTDWARVTTEEVREGDYLPIVKPTDRYKISPYAYLHGMFFGDGTRANGELHLFGRKADAAARLLPGEAFDEGTRADERVLRQCPLAWGAPPDGAYRADRRYLMGFLAGYMATDGSVDTVGNATISSSREDELRAVAELFRELGVRCSEPYVAVHGGAENNFVENRSELYEIRLTAVDLRPDFFLRDDHRERWQSNLGSTRRDWAKVVKVERLAGTHPVLCAEVPGYEQFVVEGFVLTSNCGFRSTRDIDLDFAGPFCDVMDFLMLGVGMGSDVRGAGKVTIAHTEEDPAWTHVVEDSREGWVEALRVQLTGFVTGRLPAHFDYSKVRPEGAVLKTFGGTASGYRPLQNLLTAVWNILRPLAGKPITVTAIADIVNHIGKCVVAGNIRRSAEILIGEAGDDEFMRLKDPSLLWEYSLKQTARAEELPAVRKIHARIARLRKSQEGHSAASPVFLAAQDRIDRLKRKADKLLAADPAWSDLDVLTKTHPLWTHRWASNNTLLFARDADFSEVAKQIATNGEPGVAFLDNIRAYGRMNGAGATLPDPNFWQDPLVSGFNPCVPAGTRILTRDGYRPIETLVGQRVDVWNGEAWSAVQPRVTGRDQPLVRVTLSSGVSLTCTDYHEWLLAPQRRGDSELRVRARDLQPGDALAKYDMPVVEGGRSWDLAYTHGFFCGDGQTNDSGSKGALLYGVKRDLIPHLSGTSAGEPDDYGRVWFGMPKEMPEKFSVPHDLDVPSRLAWLAGLLDADGCVLANPNSRALQLSSVELQFLSEVRLLLTTLGVQAKVSLGRVGGDFPLPDGKGGTQEYACKPVYRLLINASDTYRLVQLGLRTRRLDVPAARPQRDARRFVTVVAVDKVGVADVVYCFEDPISHRGTFEGVVTGQCAEQPLEDGELCCLGELNPNAHDTLDDYLVTVKYAYMYCKSVTMVPTNHKGTNKVMTRNRRVGLSMMGVFAMYERLGMQECVRWWDTAYHEVRRWDRTYSEWLGVNRSIKVTSVKPGGTIPLLVGEEGGMKAPTAKWYFRTMRIEHNSPLVKKFAAAGYRVEKDRASPRTVVVYFPVKDRTNARTADQVSLWEQMELLAALQAHWSDNMVSNTITFRPHEAADIGRALAAFATRVKAVSFLPLLTHGYPQAPYIPITETEYEAAVAQLSPLDLSGVGHEVDEKYCTGETCEIRR